MFRAFQGSEAYLLSLLRLFQLPRLDCKTPMALSMASHQLFHIIVPQVCVLNLHYSSDISSCDCEHCPMHLPTNMTIMIMTMILLTHNNHDHLLPTYDTMMTTIAHLPCPAAPYNANVLQQPRYICVLNLLTPGFNNHKHTIQSRSGWLHNLCVP